MRKTTEYTLGIFKLSDGEQIVGFSSDLKQVEDFLNTGNYPYTFRNLSCINKEFCIVGNFSGEFGLSFGVQEWCWDFEDAKNLLNMMKYDKRFSNLSIEKSNLNSYEKLIQD